ncbi:hypothetical protein [Moraxella lacunata]|uniref:hypothetical protein n=1 Tax=Moraxella lacunata TaxID=477 RepID=UPI003EE031E7
MLKIKYSAIALPFGNAILAILCWMFCQWLATWSLDPQAQSILPTPTHLISTAHQL